MGRRRRRQGGPSGILSIDKPEGVTSATLARAIGRRLESGRAGHAGTLDPMATGVLVVLLGEAAKLSRWLVAQDKEYLATFQLGTETDTLDRMGEVVATHVVPPGALDESRIKEVLGQFVGRRAQVAPAYSAIRVDGKRLMDEARAGRAVDPPTRDVQCFDLELREVDVERSMIELRIHCSKGYYVRSLARDIGRELGIGGHVASLRRTRSGPFSVTSAALAHEAGVDDFVPLSAALGAIPIISLDAQQCDYVRHGRKIPAQADLAQALLVDTTGLPLAMASRTEDGQWQVERGLNWPSGDP